MIVVLVPNRELRLNLLVVNSLRNLPRNVQRYVLYLALGVLSNVLRNGVR